MATIGEAMALAMQYHQAGNFAEAERIYRQILEAEPREANALHLLGVLASQAGQHKAALELIRQALAINPDVAEFHSNLALVNIALGRSDEAVSCYEEARRLQPESRQALKNLGNLLKQMGRLPRAEAIYREALRLEPNDADALTNLGAALAEQGKVEESLTCYRNALNLRPILFEAHHNLGLALVAAGKYDEAIASYEQALLIKPGDAVVLNSMAGAYRDQGRMDEAIGCLRNALAVAPALQFIHGNLLLALQYYADYDPETTFVEHVRWASHLGVSPALPLPPVDRAAGRRLRIGYVSPDFRQHVLGRYSETVIAAHDRGQFEVYCYSNVTHPDLVTERLQASADRWRSLVGLTDASAAEIIRADRIDLLIDLAGHTSGNRLGVFALKPARIQVTHLGYPSSTGLAAIDYRLTDAYGDPPGQTERYHTEKLMRLPELQWCYLPPPEPEVGPLPARQRGTITFGSFNNLCKVTEQRLALWAQIVTDMPGSRMVVLTGAGSAGDERVLKAFARQGIGKERITLLGMQSPDSFLRQHHDVDICLDTYPFTGGFTTADALWMGVPVVTLAGPSCVTRQGIGVLVQVGLKDLVTETPAAYVAAAISLARDLPRLEALRGQLRERLRLSLGDIQRFTRHLEAAYRTMWEK